MTDIVDAGIAAAKGVARSMTSGLINSALSEGWNPKTAVSLGVKFNELTSKFEIKNESNPDVKEAEYGTEEASPAPAIRKFANRTQQYEAQFIKTLSSKVGIDL